MDNAAVSLSDGRVLLITADPVSMVPGLGAKTSAWLSVHLIASDYTTSGARPQFAAFTFNFPPEVGAKERGAYLRELGRASKELGVSIVAGHTGSYPGAALTVIGGGTMFGVAPAGGYVDPSMARPGDVVLMTKGAAIEATLSLASSFPRQTAEKVGAQLARKARGLVGSCSTVKDALAASSVGLGAGGVTSMHDATEGGVLGALDEMASASGRSFEVDPEAIPVSPEASAVCSAFGLDPLRTMGEGALLLTCDPAGAAGVRRALARGGLAVAEVGRVKSGRGLWLGGGGGRASRFEAAPDEYWAAYDRAARALGGESNHFI